MQAVRVLTD